MLTLYYSPGACSLAVHIALTENDLKYNLRKVDLATKKIVDGADLTSVNPKDYVPVIQLEDGSVLTECAAILFYITEQNATNNNIISPGSFDRYRLQEALTFVSSELHKGVGAFFDRTLPQEFKKKVQEKISKRLDYVENILSKNEFFLGNTFTVVDGYFFTIGRWFSFLDTELDLKNWPKFNAYLTKISERDKVQQALKEEGITYAPKVGNKG